MEDPSILSFAQGALEQILRGDYASVGRLLDGYQQEGRGTAQDQAFAEALGLVAVKLEAREMGLRRTLEELRNAKARLVRENRQLRSALGGAPAERLETSTNPAMAEALRLVERAAPSSVPVLILGESGTGKEVFAQRVHRLSPRQQAPFVALNCAALPESLLEAELFGVERGTATGVEARAGKFEAAHGGTIFLDEIGDMSLATQARILRVLQEREVMRLGSHTPKRIDFRLLAATHRELPKLVEEGRFRQDLYYRLAIVTVTLPPLRERPEDLLPLARLFLRTLGPGHGHERPSLDGSAERALLAHPWPGNIRELRNVLERALLLSDDGVIRQADLGLSGGPRRSAPGAALPGLRALRPDPAEQARAIREALEACRGRKGEAAKALGISRETLRLKLRRLGLD